MFKLELLKKEKRRISLLMQKTQVQSLGLEDPLKKEMATRSSILAWEIPCIDTGDGSLISLGQEDTLDKEMATRSSILA